MDDFISLIIFAAVILMTGVVANIGLPGSLTGKFQALPFDIYYLAAEYQGPTDLDRAFGTAIVLLLLTGTLLVLAHLVRRRLEGVQVKVGGGRHVGAIQFLWLYWL